MCTLIYAYFAPSLITPGSLILFLKNSLVLAGTKLNALHGPCFILNPFLAGCRTVNFETEWETTGLSPPILYLVFFNFSSGALRPNALRK